MNDKQIKEMFEQLNPTKEQTNRMWRRLEENSNQGHHKRYRRRPMKIVAAAAVAVAVLTASGFGIDAATDGRIGEALLKVFHLSEKQQIVREAEKISENGIEVYAPEILHIDENLLIFGNLRGILVYDLKQETVIGTIDTQAIGCIYFDSDEKQTCVVKHQNELTIFNTKAGKTFGTYYTYEIAADEAGNLLLESKGEDKEGLQTYMKLWQDAQKNRVDTFDTFYDNDAFGRFLEDSYKYDGIMYSRESVRWTDGNGKEHVSYLTIRDGNYVVCTYKEDTQKFEQQSLML